MTTQTEALTLAREYVLTHSIDAGKVFIAIEEALAQPEKEQEPVAHIPLKALELIKSPTLVLTNVPLYGYSAEGTVPVYATPPQRTWVSLTDEEINQAYADSYKGIPLHEGIEAKLKEKNT